MAVSVLPTPLCGSETRPHVDNQEPEANCELAAEKAGNAAR